MGGASPVATHTYPLTRSRRGGGVYAWASFFSKKMWCKFYFKSCFWGCVNNVYGIYVEHIDMHKFFYFYLLSYRNILSCRPIYFSICMYVYVCMYVCTCTYVCMYVCTMNACIHAYNYVSIFFFNSVYLSIDLSVSLSTYPSVYSSVV